MPAMSAMSATPRVALAAAALFALPIAVAPPPAVAASATAQDAASVLSTMQAMQQERWEEVDNYTIVKAIEVAGGMQAPQYFEKMSLDGGQTTFRLVPPPLYEREMLAKAGFPQPSPDGYRDMATGYEMLGGALETGGGDQPPMPGASDMMGDMAMFLRFGADALENMDDGSADAKEDAAEMRMFAERARLEGREQVTATSGGATREAFKLVADDLNLEQEADGGTFTLNTATVWIDTEHYVPLRMTFDGEVDRGDGEPQSLTIEKLNLDYRQVGPLYEPFREVGKINGLMQAMSEKERKEMEQAKEQLAEAKKQLDALPPEQKEMAMRMMGGQIEKFEKMVEGDAFETSLNVVSVAVNEGPPTPYGLGDVTVGGPAAASYPAAMTMAGESDGAELSVMARLEGGYELSLSFESPVPFPEVGGEIPVNGASGSVRRDGHGVAVIEKGVGTITVTERTDTHIAGEFAVVVDGSWNPESGESGDVSFSADGSYDSGAPAGPHQAPRGSPIPAMFGQP